MNAEFTLHNYKKIKDLKVEFREGNLYFIKGPTESGKSSVLQAIQDLAKGTSPNKNKLTHGEDEGFVTGVFDINGADGEVYKVVMEYKDGKDDKFTLYRPDGTKTTKKTDIATIFKYNAFTVEDFFAWGLSAEGKRKQAAILLELLPEEVKQRYQEISIKTHPQKGTLFEDRKKANYEVARLEKVIESNTLTEEELEIIEKSAKWPAALAALKIEYEEMLQKNAEVSTHEEKLSNLNQQWNASKERRDEFNKRKIDEIEKYDRDIEELERKLAALKQSKSVYEQEAETKSKDLDIEVENARKAYEVESAKKPEQVDLSGMRERIRKNEEAIETAKILILKKETWDNNNKALTEIRIKAEELTKELESLRNEQKELIKNNLNTLENLTIKDDELVYVENDMELPFNENSVSYSVGGEIVFKIQTMINKKLPIWLIGKAAEYDETKIQRFADIAKERSGIIIADMVDTNEKELKIIVHDKTKS